MIPHATRGIIQVLRRKANSSPLSGLSFDVENDYTLGITVPMAEFDTPLEFARWFNGQQKLAKGPPLQVGDVITINTLLPTGERAGSTLLLFSRQAFETAPELADTRRCVAVVSSTNVVVISTEQITPVLGITVK